MASPERERNWATCIQYLVKGGDIPTAKRLAKQDGIAFNTSVWITALCKMVKEMCDSSGR